MATKVITTNKSAALVNLERTRFFPRQLVTPEDLTQDQIYFQDKLRRHNRLLHGWGVVCGCAVKPAKDENGNLIPWTVMIERGYLLGPHGDEIIVDDETRVDLRCEGLEGTAVGPCGDQFDPWCSKVTKDRRPGEPLYIALRYDECQSRPVRVYPATCGCEETACEYSRIRDSRSVKVLNRPPGGAPAPTGLTGDPLPECPACPAEPWVTLAMVTPRANGEIQPADIHPFIPKRIAYASWIHGTSAQIEFPDRVQSSWRAGFYLRVEGKPNTDNWFHFAIPTPVIVNGNRLRIDSVMLRFATSSAKANVTAIHVYDGEQKITAHNGIKLNGDYASLKVPYKRFMVADTPEIQWGLGISVNVSFDSGSGAIHFISAGGDFLL